MDFVSKFSWALLIFVLLCFSTSKNGVEATHRVFEHLQAVEPKQVDETYRTGYHFQPHKNWMNDPNAPMYYKGYYHLFYQYNPRGAVWGNIVWAHSASKDLINWKPLPPAIYPSKPFDAYGCWSGSATTLPGDKPVILYTGIVDRNKTQVQNYAVPADYNDPLLVKWVKPKDNPIIAPNGKDVNKTAFRDPTTAWLIGGWWRTLVSGSFDRTGMAYLYKSRDFVNWTKVDHPLHEKKGTGNWECVDFFPVIEKGKTPPNDPKQWKHVLKVSLDETRYDYYTVGTYDFMKEQYVPDNTSIDGWGGRRIDYGNLYASKSFFDPVKKRRIIWGWSNESSTKEDDVAKGWAGIQTIPRTVWLDQAAEGDMIVQWPVEEVESLRGQKVFFENAGLGKGERIRIHVSTPAQADVEATFTFDPPSFAKAEKFNPRLEHEDPSVLCQDAGGGLGHFGLWVLASEDEKEFTRVYFKVFKEKEDSQRVLMCTDLTRSSLKKDVWKPVYGGWVEMPQLTDGNYKLSLRTLIDHSVVEAFASGGRTVMTSRVYPTLAVKDKVILKAFNDGAEPITVAVNAWSMNKPKEMN